MKQGWEIKKLGEVCESDLGKTLNQSKDTGELYPYLCAINVLWDKIDFATIKQTRFEKSELERYSVQKGDLLICEGGDIGRAAIWNKDEPMLYQNALHRVRFNGSVVPRFCLLYLRFLKNIGLLDSQYGKGVTIKHLVKSSLLSIPIPIPPLPEQEKIVSELDCLSGILEKKRQQLKELDALAQSIFYEMFGDPVTNEREWEVKEIQEIFKVTSSKRILQSEWKENGIPFFKVAEIVALIKGEKINPSVFIDETNYEELCKANLVPTEGDILITSRGTLGQCYIVKKGDRFYFQDGMITWLSPKKNLATPIFTKGVFLNDSFFESLSNIANNSTIAYISIKQLSKMRLILPPLPLQQTFATKIEAIESQKALIKQSLGEVETLFNSRMQEYFG